MLNRKGWLIRGLGTRYFCSSKMADSKGSALVILAEGAEEMEAVITTDVLRRGKVIWYCRISLLKHFALWSFCSRPRSGTMYTCIGFPGGWPLKHPWENSRNIWEWCNIVFFLERTNCECIIDRFSRIILYRWTAHSFVKSQVRLLNAYNEPGMESLILFPLQLHRSQ